MKIEIYLDDNEHPIKIITPPQKLVLDSLDIDDGEHKLKLKTISDDGTLLGQKSINFAVQNGPTIDVHGLKENQTVSGDFEMIVNAYGSEIGDEFQIDRIETPAPAPTWAWVLTLFVMAGAAGFLSTSLHNRDEYSSPVVKTDSAITSSSSSNDGGAPATADSAMGLTVYGNNCSSCHQATGGGLPGVFPPLKGNAAVLNDDPSDHISAVVKGLQGKVIDGVSYASPMPAFGDSLSDEEIVAVVNHERTQWGNAAKPITVADVAKFKGGSSDSEPTADTEAPSSDANASVEEATQSTTEDTEAIGSVVQNVKLGETVYGNNCSSCHQAGGTGLPGVFPPLKGNPAVLDKDPSDHVSAIINGLQGKAIDGVEYASPMPPFGASLSDEEVAAVVNHERKQWGNNGDLVSVEWVTKFRKMKSN